MPGVLLREVSLFERGRFFFSDERLEKKEQKLILSFSTSSSAKNVLQKHDLENQA